MSETKGKPPVLPPKPQKLSFITASASYEAQDKDELSFQEGDFLYLVDSKSDCNWWRARLKGQEGLVPSDHFADQSEAASANPFQDACKRGNVQMLEECLLNKMPVNVQDKAGNTGLHWACRGGHAQVVQRLLELGQQLNTNLANRLGEAPLHLAARKGSRACILLLKSHPGTDLMMKDGEGQTAYELATDPEAKQALKIWMQELDPCDSGMSDYDLSEDECD